MNNGSNSIMITIDKERCCGRMACMRICPTEAIRVRNGKAQILEDRCIDCGECLRACPFGAIVPLTDSFTNLSRFKYTIAVPSPVLFGQFHQDVMPGPILSALKRIGFDEAIDVSCSCDAVSMAIQEYLDNYHGPKPLISSFCPTIVRLIQIKYPDLAELLIPIEAPMEIGAREAKHTKAKELGIEESQIGAIYITPCPSKMVDIRHHTRKEQSYLDGAISITDIYSPLLSAVVEEMKSSESNSGSITCRGVGWAILGGQLSTLRAENSFAVGGLSHVVRVFDDIESGRLRDIDYIECHACAVGCIGGSLTVENPYFARSRIIRLTDTIDKCPRPDREKVEKLYKQGYFSLEKELTTRPLRPLDDDVARAIEKMKQRDAIYQTLPGIDCGACGAPSCKAFAEDVVRGWAEITDCVIKSQRKMKQTNIRKVNRNRCEKKNDT